MHPLKIHHIADVVRHLHHPPRPPLPHLPLRPAPHLHPPPPRLPPRPQIQIPATPAQAIAVKIEPYYDRVF